MMFLRCCAAVGLKDRDGACRLYVEDSCAASSIQRRRAAAQDLPATYFFPPSSRAAGARLPLACAAIAGAVPGFIPPLSSTDSAGASPCEASGCCVGCSGGMSERPVTWGSTADRRRSQGGINKTPRFLSSISLLLCDSG